MREPLPKIVQYHFDEPPITIPVSSLMWILILAMWGMAAIGFMAGMDFATH